MHRLKYAQYVERVEVGLKSNPRCFFTFANLKRNSSGNPSAMFLGGTCARNAQEIADFEVVYVSDNSQEDFVVNGVDLMIYYGSSDHNINWSKKKTK
jgi:hypothetical protein